MVLERLHAAFQRAASQSARLRAACCAEHGVDGASVRRSTHPQRERCAILTTAKTFERFRIDRLRARRGDGEPSRGVHRLQQRRHGGRFSFGLSTRRQHAEAPAMIGAALDAAFEVS